MTGGHRHSQYCLKISGIPGNAWFPQLTVTYIPVNASTVFLCTCMKVFTCYTSYRLKMQIVCLVISRTLSCSQEHFALTWTRLSVTRMLRSGRLSLSHISNHTSPVYLELSSITVLKEAKISGKYLLLQTYYSLPSFVVFPQNFEQLLMYFSISFPVLGSVS